MKTLLTLLAIVGGILIAWKLAELTRVHPAWAADEAAWVCESCPERGTEVHAATLTVEPAE